MASILGISAFYHDSAAALVIDGKIVAAAQEERFTREKYDEHFPVHSIEYCLKEAGLNASKLDYVAFYDKPYLKCERLLETYLSYAPRGYRSFLKAMPLWLNQKLRLPREMRKGLHNAYRKRFIFTEHHESHAASAFYPSPFEEAAILTLDGVGEWATASFGYGKRNRITLTHEQRFPHSVGLLYSAFTYYCGFKVNSGEYKLMGLAPYGKPQFAGLIKEKLLDLKEDGSIRMDMSYFNYCQGLTMTSEKFHQLFGGPPRKPDALLTERDMDLAASIQAVTEEIMLRSARHVHAQTGLKKLCLAGGVALNCVGNGKLLRDGPFDEIWIQPAAGDAGGALGAALFTWHQLLDEPRQPKPADTQSASYLGPAYSAAEIQSFLDTSGACYERIDDEQELTDRVADEIAHGRVVGWFQGRMEFGPRALGSRSIIGDPRNPEMQTVMNVKVKFREGFRPFAPAVLREKAHEYFDVPPDLDSPYMLMVAPVAETKRRPVSAMEASASGIGKLKVHRSEIPAVTHVDYSARLQTVDRERHGLYRKLLESFYRKTGCPVLINTSFNLGWDPIVCTPAEAYSTFMACDLDVLCMGPFVLTKRAQPVWVSDRREFEQFEQTFCCPCGSGATLRRTDHLLIAADCHHKFPVTDGIPQLFWPHDGASNPADITAFYEEMPFPNYDEHDSLRSLMEQSRQRVYARALDESIPYNSSVLEVGCGTGQLSNFLGISCRSVTGTDVCLNSLRLAEKFRREQDLSRVRFVQANFFRLPYQRDQFDVILCNGVLHRTGDPRGGFENLLPLLRPGGYIVIGLYNPYGRMITNASRLFCGPPTMDHDRHPHGFSPTFGKVLQWFEQAGLDFVNAMPSLTGSGKPRDLFQPSRPGSKWNRFTVQMKQAAAGKSDGGFVLMVARRPQEKAALGMVSTSSHFVTV